MDIAHNTASVMTITDFLLGVVFINYGKTIRFSAILTSPLILTLYPILSYIESSFSPFYTLAARLVESPRSPGVHCFYTALTPRWRWWPFRCRRTIISTYFNLITTGCFEAFARYRTIVNISNLYIGNPISPCVWKPLSSTLSFNYSN